MPRRRHKREHTPRVTVCQVFVLPCTALCGLCCGTNPTKTRTRHRHHRPPPPGQRPTLKGVSLVAKRLEVFGGGLTPGPPLAHNTPPLWRGLSTCRVCVCGGAGGRTKTSKYD